jgi:uncharacterized phage protein (TIGR02218 family)
MRTINGSLQTKLTSGTTTLCHITRITRKDGVVKRFTDHNADVVVGGFTYESDDSVLISAITTATNNGMQSTNCDVIFSTSGIADIDVVRGVYDNATVTFAIVDYTDTALGEIILMTGIITVFDVTDKGRGSFEIRGLLTRGDARVGEYYSAECRADLGDTRCKVNLATYQTTGVVHLVERATSLQVDFTGTPGDGFYSFGVITFTSGNNIGLSLEVMTQAAIDATYDRIVLPLAFPYTPEVGDTFTLTAGCNHQKTTCKTKFNNLVNFRGEPFVPGQDILNDLDI